MLEESSLNLVQVLVHGPGAGAHSQPRPGKLGLRQQESVLQENKSPAGIPAERCLKQAASWQVSGPSSSSSMSSTCL